MIVDMVWRYDCARYDCKYDCMIIGFNFFYSLKLI